MIVALNSKNINRHLMNRSCQDYKDVIFVCRKCSYNTKNIAQIKLHTKSCNGEECIDDPEDKYRDEITRLDTQNKYLQRKIRRLERELSKQDKNMNDLNTILDIERMKTRIFGHILEQKTDISISNIIREEDNCIHVYEIEKGILPVYLHKDVHVIHEEVSNDETILLPIQPKKKEVFRTINCVELAEEVNQYELQTKVDNVDEEVKDIVEANFETIDMSECHKEIIQSFDKLRETRTYNIHLAYIKKIRCKMLGWLNIKEYEDLILEHIQKISVIFRIKRYEKKKTHKIICEGLSPLEMRLTKYGKYYETDIDSEDIERLKVSLECCTVFPKEYKPFKRSFKRFHNYNMVLFTLKKCAECYLFNKYGFHNLVYISMPNSTDSDPYSYYYLEKIEGDKRCWKMDCRLEDISVDLSTELLAFCVDLYRKIYHDMFRDNKYRSDCEDVYSLAGNEMEQLADNIITLHNQEKCRDLLREIVKEKATLVPTDNDKINIRTHDSTQKKRFLDYRSEYNHLDVPVLLFPEISKEDAQYFLNRFKS